MPPRQLSIKGLNGGMRDDVDPARLPANTAQRIINMHYNEYGQLQRSKGWGEQTYAPTGKVLDVITYLNQLLVASDVIQIIASLDASTADWTGDNINSKFLKSNYGYVYYLSYDSTAGQNTIRKFRIKDSAYQDFLAGVEVPSVDFVQPLKYTSDDNPYRVNQKDNSNDDSSLIVNMDLSEASNTTIRPTNNSKTIPGVPGTTYINDPEKAYDNDEATFAELYAGMNQALLTIFGIDNPLPAMSNPVLSIKASVSGIESWGDSNDSYLRYSLNGGSTWTGVASGNFDDTYTVNLDADQDMSLVMVRLFVAATWDDTNGYSSPTGKLYDVKITGDFTDAASFVQLKTSTEVPTVIGREAFNKLWIPIKTNNLTTSRLFKVVVEQYDALTEAKSIYETVEVTLDDTSVGIEVPLSKTYEFGGDDLVYLVVRIQPGEEASGESIVLYRAVPWLIESNGKTSVLDGDVTDYSDREPLMAFGLVGNLESGLYEYAGALENDSGFRSNPTDNVRLGVDQYDVVYFNLGSFKTALESVNSTDEMAKFILARTLVGGGTLYELKALSVADMAAYYAMDDPTPAVWGMTDATIIPPQILIDGSQTATATVVETNHDTPDDLDPMNEVLVIFRSRAFILARIPDVLDVVRTYIRWSEVDIFDYWDPLNEMYIPDDIIAIRPLREDMMLAWSLTRTYRIIPSGTGFEWLKIADVGIGGTDDDGNVVGAALSVATNDMVFWVNNKGAWFFDGAQVQPYPNSIENLSWIKAFIRNAGRMSLCERDNQIWLHGGLDMPVEVSATVYPTSSYDPYGGAYPYASEFANPSQSYDENPSTYAEGVAVFANPPNSGVEKFLALRFTDIGKVYKSITLYYTLEVLNASAVYPPANFVSVGTVFHGTLTPRLNTYDNTAKTTYSVDLAAYLALYPDLTLDDIVVSIGSSTGLGGAQVGDTITGRVYDVHFVVTYME